MHRQLIDFQIAGDIVLQDQREIGGPLLCACKRVLTHFKERTASDGGDGNSKRNAAGHEKIGGLEVHFFDAGQGYLGFLFGIVTPPKRERADCTRSNTRAPHWSYFIMLLLAQCLGNFAPAGCLSCSVSDFSTWQMRAPPTR